MARILLIDDESEIRLITRRMLERAGYEVAEAESGDEGIKAMKAKRPDIVLLDVMLGGPNGWEICREIKSDERLKDIPVVMFTVRTEDDSIRKSRQCGADAHINKPFEMTDLLETLKSLLQK